MTEKHKQLTQIHRFLKGEMSKLEEIKFFKRLTYDTKLKEYAAFEALLAKYMIMQQNFDKSLRR